MFPNQETSADSKYSVANILSSMASGQLLSPTSHQYNAYPGYQPQPVCMPQYKQQYTPYPMTFLHSASTPTLTPTTLASLEQTFTELQSVAAPRGIELSGQSGFVPPVLEPAGSDYSQDSQDSDSDREPDTKRARREQGSPLNMSTAALSTADSNSQRKQTRRNRHEKLNPEEERRRAIRRERNKLAAARCRQRRVDLTNCLVQETEKLETENSGLEQEIHSLKKELDQLEFLLQAHVPLCKLHGLALDFKIKTEPADFILNASTSSSSCPSPAPGISRPKSLALGAGAGRQLPVVVSCAGPGIPLSTPTSGLFTYTSLDSLVEGSTGLTPLTAGPTSCASQLHKSESDNSGESLTSPTLISL